MPKRKSAKPRRCSASGTQFQLLWNSTVVYGPDPFPESSRSRNVVENDDEEDEDNDNDSADIAIVDERSVNSNRNVYDGEETDVDDVVFIDTVYDRTSSNSQGSDIMIISEQNSTQQLNSNDSDSVDLIVIEDGFKSKKTRLTENTNFNQGNSSVLDEYVGDSSFYINIKSETVSDSIQLNSFTLLVEQNESVFAATVRRLYISEIPGRSFLYLGNGETVDYIVIVQNMDFEFFTGLKNRYFHLVLDQCEKNDLKINVFLEELNPGLLKDVKCINKVMAYFYGIQQPEYEVGMMMCDPSTLYNAVKQYHKLKNSMYRSIDVQHKFLIPELRPYQHAAVNWMIQRETKTCTFSDDHHCLYDECTTDEKQKLYYNKFTGHISVNKPLPETIPTGGILADEMGLGKTVEILSLILVNPRPNDQIIMDDIFIKNEEQTLKQETQNIQNNSDLPLDSKIFESNSNKSESDMDVDIKIKCETTITNIQDTIPIISLDSHDNLNISDTYNELLLEKSLCERLQLLSSGVSVNKANKSVLHRIDKKSKHVKKAKQQVASMNKIKAITAEDVKSNIDETIESVIIKFCYNGVFQKLKRKPIKSLNRLSMEKLYEEKLMEVNVRRKVPALPILTVHCVCGFESPLKPRICCQRCGQWQHKKCVGVKDQAIDPYHCPQCWQLKVPLTSGATLIVTPTSISCQWVEEIVKHISDPDFNVVVYRGVQKGFIQPKFLASSKIVITTYEILTKELCYVDVANNSPKLRHAKRFYAPPSPLQFVEWWRVCLDEAQMVEMHTSKKAEMVRLLLAVHRWAVTGTPIQKSIQDLFGLICFLGIEPFNTKACWQYALYNSYCLGNYEPAHNLMCRIMWRTMKNDVLDQLGVPPQMERIHWLHFAPVEEHFYRLQHIMCSHDFLNKMRKFEDKNIKLRLIDRKQLSKLLVPLLSLRKACTHHLVVKDFAPDKKTMSLAELQEALIKKTKTECEDFLRQFVAACNGIAAIDIMCNNFGAAVEQYETIIKLNEEYKGKLSVDTLQMIHTLHNLSETLEQHPMYTTFKVDELRDQSSNLEETYMKKREAPGKATFDTLEGLEKEIDSCIREIGGGRGEWWELMIHYICAEGHEDEFVNRIRNDLMDKMTKFEAKRAMERVKAMKGIEYQLLKWDSLVKNQREKTIMTLHRLQDYPLQDLVNESVDCHLRTYSSKTKKCSLCSCEKLLKNYETSLFAVNEKDEKHIMVGECRVLGKVVETSWQWSEMEQVLRSMLSHIRLERFQVPGKKDLFKEANKHLKLLEIMKKEFKHLRLAWMHLFDRAAAQDELNMARLRLRVRFPGEPIPIIQKRSMVHQLSSHLVNKVETIHIIEEFEIPSHAARLNAEMLDAKANLRKKTGMLQYLENLNKDPDPCPICHVILQGKWSVLLCGHYYCLDCIQTLLKLSITSSSTTVKCAVCRETTRCIDISFVNLEDDREIGYDADIKIAGSHSRKVGAIIKTILSIKKEDSSAKVIIFSNWDKLLDILQEALSMNGINVRQLKTHRFQNCLADFKNKDLDVDALLLPVRSGAKGLNLTEATHVVLVEPILNPGDELQAIGRVHRIGQTRKTYVHRFLMRGTIEERIHNAMHSGSEDWSDDTVTLNHLLQLFTDAEELKSSPSSFNQTTVNNNNNTNVIDQSIPTSNIHAAQLATTSAVESDISNRAGPSGIGTRHLESKSIGSDSSSVARETDFTPNTTGVSSPCQKNTNLIISASCESQSSEGRTKQFDSSTASDENITQVCAREENHSNSTSLPRTNMNHFPYSADVNVNVRECTRNSRSKDSVITTTKEM